MRKLLILPLLVLLTGCVSYYYPETALEDGVYYAEDDPSYVVYSGAYSGVAYYPWYSLDYFYMGYYPYPGFSIGYGYPSGFSIGFNYAFSPWYYPSHYYGYYSPWYGSYHYHRYSYHPARRPYRGYYDNRHDGHHGKKRHDRDDRRDRYAGHDGGDRYDEPYRYKRDSGRIDDEYRDERERKRGGGEEQLDYGRSSTVRRYVSTTPGGQDGNRGMVIRNRGVAKVGESRLDVNKQAKTGAVKASSAKTRQKTVTRAPSPPKTSSSSRPKASASSKRSSSASHSSSKGKSSRNQNRR